jgi:hypothetical protein
LGASGRAPALRFDAFGSTKRPSLPRTLNGWSSPVVKLGLSVEEKTLLKFLHMKQLMIALTRSRSTH